MATPLDPRAFLTPWSDGTDTECHLINPSDADRAIGSTGETLRDILATGRGSALQATLTEYFGTGTYVRSLDIAPGSVLEGLRHRHSTILIILRGSIDIILSHGEVWHMTAGTITVAPPMTRRAVATSEGATVLTVHHLGDINPADPDRASKLRSLLIAEDGP